MSEESFWLAPSPTEHRPSRDYLFSRHFYRKFSAKKRGHGLQFDGYIRALCLYGSEDNIVARLSSTAIAFLELRTTNPGKVQELRRQAIERGFTNPEHRPDLNRIAFLPPTEFVRNALLWGKAGAQEEFLVAIATYPQPKFWHENSNIQRRDHDLALGLFIPAPVSAYIQPDQSAFDENSEEEFIEHPEQNQNFPDNPPVDSDEAIENRKC